MATRIDTLLDKNEDTVLPITRVKAVYDDSNNRLDTLLAGINTSIANCKKAATVIVGTSTSGHTSAHCDYLCDGEADEVQINAAISSLSGTGGKIVLLEGTYSIKSAITLNKSNVTLEGLGASTVIEVATSNSYGSTGDIITSSGTSVVIRNMYLEYNSSTSVSMTGITLSGSTSLIEDVNVSGCTNAGITLSGVSDCIIRNNIIRSCTSYSIYIMSGATYNLVTFNIVNTGITNSGSNNTTTGNLTHSG